MRYTYQFGPEFSPATVQVSLKQMLADSESLLSTLRSRLAPFLDVSSNALDFSSISLTKLWQATIESLNSHTGSKVSLFQFGIGDKQAIWEESLAELCIECGFYYGSVLVRYLPQGAWTIHLREFPTEQSPSVHRPVVMPVNINPFFVVSGLLARAKFQRSHGAEWDSNLGKHGKSLDNVTRQKMNEQVRQALDSDALSDHFDRLLRMA